MTASRWYRRSAWHFAAAIMLLATLVLGLHEMSGTAVARDDGSHAAAAATGVLPAGGLDHDAADRGPGGGPGGKATLLAAIGSVQVQALRQMALARLSPAAASAAGLRPIRVPAGLRPAGPRRPPRGVAIA